MKKEFEHIIKIVTKFLSSDVTSSEIARLSGLSRQSIDKYRNNPDSITKMQFDNLQSLFEYAVEYAKTQKAGPASAGHRSYPNIYLNSKLLHVLSGGRVDDGVGTATYAEGGRHYTVNWDFRPLLSSNNLGKYEWPSPHSAGKLKVNQTEVLGYYQSDKFMPSNQVVSYQDIELKLVNIPIELHNGIYAACATDADNNVYMVEWSLYSLIDPTDIIMTTDKNYYCTKCLKHYMPNHDTGRCDHVWAPNK